MTENKLWQSQKRYTSCSVVKRRLDVALEHGCEKLVDLASSHVGY
jgi:hypothetical protein